MMEPSKRVVRRSPRGEGSRDWEEVASTLLEEGLVLTALELHTELLESGKELVSLRDYFSNPGNFESAIPQPPTALLGSDLGEGGGRGRLKCAIKLLPITLAIRIVCIYVIYVYMYVCYQ